jgi:hypothetical protein
VWWAGVPVLIAFFTWVPYIVLNYFHEVSWSVFRFPVIPPVLFDTTAYFQWIGLAVNGLDAGGHIGVFGLIVQMLGKVLGIQASVIEIWLFSEFLSVAVSLFLLAWLYRVWTTCGKTQSRLFALLTWVAFILPFMPRPGVLTWFLPFFIFSVIGLRYMQLALDGRRYTSAILWTAGSLIASTVYPYFLVHVFLWAFALWTTHLLKTHSRLFKALFIVVILTMPVAIYASSVFALSGSLDLWLTLKERAGLAFTFLPVLSNTLLLILSWAVLFFGIARSWKGPVSPSIYAVFVGWATLLVAWLSSIFTGVYIHNDHFRYPALLLSWVSLFVIWSICVRERTIEIKKKSGVVMVIGPLLLSLFMALSYVIVKKFVFGGNDLNVIHASHWLALAAASGIVLASLYQKRQYIVWTMGVFIAFSLLLGLSARAFVFMREWRAFPLVASRQPFVEWLRFATPATASLCADFETAEQLGSFTGRLIWPNTAALLLPFSDLQMVENLKTIKLRFKSRSLEEELSYRERFDLFRQTTCYQFEPYWRVLSSVGYTRESFERLNGCPRQIIDANREALRIDSGQTSDVEAFQRLCQIVAIPSGRTTDWSLPAGYRQLYADRLFTAWGMPLPSVDRE